VFDQEVLDYLLLDETGMGRLLADIPPAAREWADTYLARLQRDRRLVSDPDTVRLFRLVLAVAARGDAIIVGRGAGHVLPVETTLHVRVVAPFEARAGFLAHTLRLTRAEAADEVRHRDDRRAQFLTRVVAVDGTDPGGYDVVVNSTRLGVEGAAQFVGWAVRTKQQFAELAEAFGPADDE
jgi:hypothetical protein